MLMAPGKIPGVSGTRCLRDNISDIKAQAAANHRGSQLIHGLIADYGLKVVQFYSKVPRPCWKCGGTNFDQWARLLEQLSLPYETC
jgi:hypothetical protein